MLERWIDGIIGGLKMQFTFLSWSTYFSSKKSNNRTSITKKMSRIIPVQVWVYSLTKNPCHIPYMDFSMIEKLFFIVFLQ